MTENKQMGTGKDAQGTGSAANQRRRQLLKASMAAPLVASLRTNTAYAQAAQSVINCVRDIAENGDPVDNWIDGGTHDSQVRATRTRYLFKVQGGGNVELPFWDARIGTGYASFDDPTQSLPDNLPPATVYGEDGTVLTLNGGNTGDKWQDATTNEIYNYKNNSATDLEALVIYEPSPDYTDIFRVGVFPQATQVPQTAIGVSLTCMDSAAPALIANANF